MTDSARTLFRLLTWLFIIAVVVQVFLAGMVVVAQQMDWGGHEGLGHMMGFLLLPMLVVAYLGKASRRVKMLTWALFITWFVQSYVLIIFLRQSMPILAAFHPVLALADFLLAHLLLRYTREEAAAAA
jgi:hypothetical protein